MPLRASPRGLSCSSRADRTCSGTYIAGLLPIIIKAASESCWNHIRRSAPQVPDMAGNANRSPSPISGRRSQSRNSRTGRGEVSSGPLYLFISECSAVSGRVSSDSHLYRQKSRRRLFRFEERLQETCCYGYPTSCFNAILYLFPESVSCCSKHQSLSKTLLVHGVNYAEDL